MRRKWIAVLGLCVLVVSGTVFSATSETANFTGTVVDSDGGPIDSASLELYLLTIDHLSFGYQMRSVAEVNSDAEGKFSFVADIRDVKGYAVFCCLAQKEGLSYGWATVTGDAEATWTITLGEPATLVGFVQNPDGTAVSEAEVRLIMLSIPGDDERFMLGIDPVDVFVTKTCSDGRFEFKNLPQDATAEFLVKKAGKGTLHTLNMNLSPESGLTYKAGQPDIMLTMADACQISGTVVTQDGQQGVGGLSVMVRDFKLPINLFYQPVTSAEDGSFTFSNLSPGEYTVFTLDDDWISEPVMVTVASDAEAEATIELTKGGTLEVTVIDGESKDPVAGVSVNFSHQQTQQYQHLVTGDNGVGSKQVLAGIYKVSAYKQGYRSSNEAGSVVVENGKTATLTIELGGQPKITGVVTDSDGKPIEGATLRMIPNWGGQRDGVKSDAKGHFSMTWDPQRMGQSEMTFYLGAMHAERNLVGVLQIAEDTEEVAVKLEKGIVATGKVIDPDGQPIAGAKAALHFHGSNFSTSFEVETLTDKKGGYELNLLAADQRYSVQISKAKGFGTGRQEVEFDSDATEVDVKDIILQIADQKVTGQVVDIDGKGLADVQLHCYGGSGQPNINTKTDADGNFVLENICAGEINITANYRIGQEYRHGNVRTEGGAEDVKVIVTSRGGSQQFVPKKAPSLVGKPLPDLTACGVTVPDDAASVLVFAWDMNQRPSRHFIKQFNAKAEMLKAKGVTVVLVQAAPVEQEKLDAWLGENSIAYPCGVIGEKVEDMKFKMGVQGLPWLILTDGEQKVIAEGFSVDELVNELK